MVNQFTLASADFVPFATVRPFMRRFVALWLALSVLILAPIGPLARPAAAGALQPPTGDVVLRVSGSIANTTDGDAALFDMAALESLPATAVVTTTAWTEGETEFEGVLLRDLLAAVGAEGNSLHAIAINDYAIDIPAGDARAYDVLIAYRMNGAPMSVRDKGPLWIIYPISQHTELEGPETEAKMIWQLRELEVR